MKIKLLDTIVLTRGQPEHGLLRGCLALLREDQYITLVDNPAGMLTISTERE